MHVFSALFIGILVLTTLVQVWLALRHIRHVRGARDEVPDAFSDRISLDEHRKAADYTVTGTRFHIAESLIGAGLLLAWTLGGGLEWFDHAWRDSGLDPLHIGVGFLISVTLVMSLLELPLSAWHTFRIEQRYGFNRSTPGLFISDHLKQMLLTLLLGIPLAYLVLWLMDVSGPLWWLYVWAVWIGFSLLMLWAYPALIAPLFNKFSPLDNAELRTRIDALLARCGFVSRGVMVMDGSRRSGHGNAYFTGLGNNKRIVFFDTLLEALEPVEIEAVLAHELGHFRRKHILKRLLTMAGMSLAGLALLGWLIDQAWFYQGLGVSTPSTHAALLLFMLVAPVFGFLLQPLFAYVSRKHEYEADDYAAAQSDAGALVRALVKLYRENASTLTPDPLYSAFHDSHPPAPLRVQHLAAQAGLSPAR